MCTDYLTNLPVKCKQRQLQELNIVAMLNQRTSSFLKKLSAGKAHLLAAYLLLGAPPD